MIPVYKIITLGDTGVGKTCLFNRFINEHYDESIPLTIGVDFMIKDIIINDKEYKLQLWDLGGLDRFRKIIRPYYNETYGVILVYDITNRETFQDLIYWLNELKNVYDLDDYSNSPAIILVGSKSDLDYKRVIQEEEVLNFAKKHGIDTVIECSAKNGNNVVKIFETLTEKMIGKMNAGYLPVKYGLPHRVLHLDIEQEKINNRCCNII